MEYQSSAMQTQGPAAIGRLARGSIILACVLVSSIREHAVLQYRSARRISVVEQPDGQLRITGGMMHSGSCVESVRQVRRGNAVTLEVKLMPANGKCYAEFTETISIDSQLNTIRLGDASSADPELTGVIWSRDRSLPRAETQSPK